MDKLILIYLSNTIDSSYKTVSIHKIFSDFEKSQLLQMCRASCSEQNEPVEIVIRLLQK